MLSIGRTYRDDPGSDVWLDGTISMEEFKALLRALRGCTKCCCDDHEPPEHAASLLTEIEEQLKENGE